MTDEQKAELCATPVTLNGRPAVISGWKQPFATVKVLNGGLSIDYSWQAVACIVERGGDFHV